MLADLIMPRMDGMELLAQIRLRHPGVEVIMLTSFADVRSAVEAMRQGAFSYFRKGGDPRELLAEIAKVQETGAAAQKFGLCGRTRTTAFRTIRNQNPFRRPY